MIIASCGFQPSSLTGDGGGSGSNSGSGSDAGSGSGSGSACAMSFSQQLDTCALTVGDPIDLTGDNSYDTNTGELTNSNGTTTVTVSRTAVTLVANGNSVDTDVIATSSFTIEPGASLRVMGPKPLVIVSFGTIDIEGILDVGVAGPGARTANACGNAAGTAATTHSGGGPGGGGGALNGDGGTGGKGDQNNNGGADGADPGQRVAFPGLPLGGCPGGAGGMPNSGAGGQGGGSIDLIAKSMVVVGMAGRIQAGGGGGGMGLTSDGGAGGGGSGGIVLIESSSVMIKGQVDANGGGGGGGAGNANGMDGMDGQLGMAPAMGGMKGGNGTNGGGGGAAGNHDGLTAADSDVGAGGGGGGAGFVAISSTPGFAMGGFCSPQQMSWTP
jgi:hypothetical protein